MPNLGATVIKRLVVMVSSLLAVSFMAACGERSGAVAEGCPSVVTQPGTGCDESPIVPDSVVVARDRWTANRPSAYEFTLTVNCFCGPQVTRPVVVAVTGTTVMSRTYADDGSPVSAQFAFAFPSIDGLFEILDDAKHKNASRADATYDKTIGYPLTLFVDYVANVVDDESAYVVSGFRKL